MPAVPLWEFSVTDLVTGDTYVVIQDTLDGVTDDA